MKKKSTDDLTQKLIGDPSKAIVETSTPLKKMDEKELNKKFKEHLILTKVIRDSVHGDIWLTQLEVDIIDTPVFQRLRRIKQLGPTDLVFPSAKHTRFEHSIGALFVAQQIIDSINKNYSNKLSYARISDRDTITIRLLALIHDIAHVPFGHTIEDEGKLLEKKQWRDNTRFDYIWKIIQPKIESNLNNIPKDEVEKIIYDLKEGLKAEEGDKDDNIHRLPKPFIVDIVGNTICADLLDYLKRDAYNTGLKMTYDPRVLTYFVLVKQTKKIDDNNVEGLRAAILLEKKPGKIKHDILNYCVDLLRLRYSLAEKSHYHRVKCIASAMVIKMLYCALEGGIVSSKFDANSQEKENNLMNFSDDSLIHTILKYKDPIKNTEYHNTASKLALKITNRELYKEIYSKNYSDESIYSSLIQYCDKEVRYNKERDLERICGLDPGSLVIYCAEKQSGKVAETKMLRYNTGDQPIVKTLKELANEENYSSSIGQELATIETLYKRLWNFYVLIDKKCLGDSQHEQIVKKVCSEFIDHEKIGVEAIWLRDYLLQGQLSQNKIFEISSELASAKDAREVMDKIGFIDKKIKSIKGQDNG